jgi:endonuclease-3 related protein
MGRDGKDLESIHGKLLEYFGRLRWWPVSNGFDPPAFEVCTGAILTQNTNWRNVEKALANMRLAGLTSPRSVAEAGKAALEKAVMPSGFYRQKSVRLKAFSGFVLSFGGFGRFARRVTREQLLGLNGIGPETADSILLYALGRPVFVIDAYTRRVFGRLGFVVGRGYEEWRSFFEASLPHDAGLFGELHAQIVELAKAHCRKSPACGPCPLKGACRHADR